MITFSFYDEIQIAECPDNLYDLKQKIKELYILGENQIDNFLLSYINKNGDQNYIFKEEHFEQIIPDIESVIISVELIFDYKYRTIDSMVDEKYQLCDIDDDNNIQNALYDNYEDNMKTKEKKEEKKEDKIKNRQIKKKIKKMTLNIYIMEQNVIYVNAKGN